MEHRKQKLKLLGKFWGKNYYSFESFIWSISFKAKSDKDYIYETAQTTYSMQLDSLIGNVSKTQIWRPSIFF